MFSGPSLGIPPVCIPIISMESVKLQSVQFAYVTCDTEITTAFDPGVSPRTSNWTGSSLVYLMILISFL
jgi:hypothetical protein